MTSLTKKLKPILWALFYILAKEPFCAECYEEGVISPTEFVSGTKGLVIGGREVWEEVRRCKRDHEGTYSRDSINTVAVYGTYN